VVTNVRALIAWPVALLGFSMPRMLLEAQGTRLVASGLRTSAHLGIGYVANIPTTFVGVSALAITPRLFGGAGVYADVKLTTSSPGDSPYYLPGVSVAQAEGTYGDQLFEQKSDWLAVNVALVYAVTSEFALYGGAGYSKEHHYRQYFDDTQSRGEFGFYWIADPAASGTRINAIGGAFLRVTRFALFQLGAEARPAGANVGITLVLAR